MARLCVIAIYRHFLLSGGASLLAGIVVPWEERGPLDERKRHETWVYDVIPQLLL